MVSSQSTSIALVAAGLGVVCLGFYVRYINFDLAAYSDVPLSPSATVPVLIGLLTLFTAATWQQSRVNKDGEFVKYHKVTAVVNGEAADAEVNGDKAGSGGKREGSRLQTDSEACFNVVNMYVGVGLWSLPYSLVVGGWESMLVLVVLLVLCFMSAETLVRLYDQSKSASHSEVGSYLQISYDAFGVFGKFAAGAFLVGEFLGTAMVLILTIWDVLASMGLPYRFGGALSTCLLAPFIWQDEWSNLAYINAFALVATVLVVFCNYYILLGKGTVEGTDEPRVDVTTRGFVRAVGLQMVALGSGTPAVPSIYQQVRNKAGFTSVMATSFGIIALFCITMAAGGVLTYGQKANMLIIDNLMENESIGLLISIMVAAASFATTPPFIAMTTEIPLALTSLKVGGGGRRAMRYLVFLLTIGGCVLLVESLDLIMELTGLACMSMTAIVLPIAMSLKVFWSETNWLKLIASVVGIAGSLATTVVYLSLL